MDLSIVDHKSLIESNPQGPAIVTVSLWNLFPSKNALIFINFESICAAWMHWRVFMSRKCSTGSMKSTFLRISPPLSGAITSVWLLDQGFEIHRLLLRIPITRTSTLCQFWESNKVQAEEMVTKKYSPYWAAVDTEFTLRYRDIGGHRQRIHMLTLRVTEMKWRKSVGFSVRVPTCFSVGC